MDKEDFLFKKLFKLIGLFYIKEEVDVEVVKDGFMYVEDVGCGYWKVVLLLMFKEIVEKEVVCVLVEVDVLIICFGGGGILVVVEDG